MIQRAEAERDNDKRYRLAALEHRELGGTGGARGSGSGFRLKSKSLAGVRTGSSFANVSARTSQAVRNAAC